LILSDTYDVPAQMIEGMSSNAFRAFLFNWFGDTRRLTHGELDLSFLKELTNEELKTARELIRRNLNLGHDHIVQGAAALRDVGAAPILRSMLEHENDCSRRLIIAGALWNLVRDPVFLSCLENGKRQTGMLMSGAHLYQVLWLDDARAITFLIDLLDHPDKSVRVQALGLLNTLEAGRRIVIPSEMPYGPADYRRRWSTSGFREMMTNAVRRFNRETAPGMVFGFQADAQEGG
jgi:hypothetical protein